MKRSTRREIAKDTLKILKQGYYLNEQGKTIGIKARQKFSTQHTQFFKGEELEEMFSGLGPEQPFKTTFEVTGESTISAVLRLQAEDEDPLTLNFASAKNPGGGFLNGSVAQEESLARSSGLYSCQLKGEKYYAIHRNTKTPFYTDNMIYSPKVAVFKNDDGEFLEDLAFTSFITSPAVNAGVIKREEPEHLDKVEAAMKGRIKKVLTLAYSKGHKTLILGAWGCGVFENDPASMAKWFHEVFQNEFAGKFKKVVFAIYSKEEVFIQPFRDLF
ncbi:MAG: TIGR02452 family protein [Saprospiraceae bacterium]|nr:TIGR02452 family protein [Saprospiraceae bacterium]MCB9324455.1 TIGR02452 family protein [Lewinellaceae bacterium]